MSDYLKAYLGGLSSDKWPIRIWLFLKGRKYRQRRHDVLVRKYMRKAARNIFNMANRPSLFAQFVRKDNCFDKGGSYHDPKA